MKFKLLKKLMFMSVFCISPFTASAEMVNINDASAAAMSHYLKGIGEVKAGSIVSYRELNGDFKNINDLTNVKGIGQGLLKKNLEDLSLTEGVVKWIKAKPKVVAIGEKSNQKLKVKKLNAKKIASKSVSKPEAKKVKKIKATDPNSIAEASLKKKGISKKAEFMK